MPEHTDHDTSGLDPDELDELDNPPAEEEPDEGVEEVTRAEDVPRGDDPEADEFGIEDDTSDEPDEGPDDEDDD